MRRRFKSLLFVVFILLVTATMQAQEAYYVMSNNYKTVTFYYDTQREKRGGFVGINFVVDYMDPDWDYELMRNSRKYNGVETAVFDISFFDYRPTGTAYMFFLCSNLSKIIGLENLNTSNVEDMGYMFYGCSSLKSLDLSSFNTSKVWSMECMFADCSSLTNLDLSNFDTHNVGNMYDMFGSCSSLTSLDLSSFNTHYVQNMSSMFAGCSGLTSLNLNGFDTTNVLDMKSMFLLCSSLETLDLSSFSTPYVMDMSSMFSHCSSLTNLDLSGFNTGSVESMTYMFYGCSSLTSLNLSSFNTGRVTKMYNMFENCSSLASLDLGSFNTSNVAEMYRMFENCSYLKTIYAGNGWNTANVQMGAGMFSGCTSLVGGNGTVYDPEHVGYDYACIDGIGGNPGYLTDRTGSGIIGLTRDRQTDAPTYYNLRGQRLVAPQRGLNVVGGKKVLVQ